ncbi:MAG: M15 family metallopeptidase [Planctomycetota bacterium]|nr:M15 family metallopeptidase [Planctomycetota bacterium]
MKFARAAMTLLVAAGLYGQSVQTEAHRTACAQLLREVDLLRIAIGAPAILLATVDLQEATGIEWRFAAGVGGTHGGLPIDGAAAIVRAGSVSMVVTALAVVGHTMALRLAGRYEANGRWFELIPRGADLVFDPCIGSATVQHLVGEQLVSMDALGKTDRVLSVLPTGAVQIGAVAFSRAPDNRPLPPPALLAPLLGEYGWPHAQIVVYEVRGQLGLVLDGKVRELPKVNPDGSFTLSPGLRGSEVMRFVRDAKGLVTALELDLVCWPKIVHPADGAFRIPLRQPLAAIRAAMAAATPPKAEALMRTPSLVDLRSLSPALLFDLRYATNDNFLGERVYDAAVPMLQREAAVALQQAQQELRAQGFGLCVFDAYRPWSITKLFFEATPDNMRQFVADPATGSRHNRGCAVDLTLYDLNTSELLSMPCGFDEFTTRAYPDWPGGNELQRWHRDLLRSAMERAGFAVYEYEWWHYDFGDWRQYPVQNQPLR